MRMEQMLIKYPMIIAISMTIVVSDQDKRLLLHSDQDISQVLNELRQENIALKTQLTQMNQTLNDQMKQENGILKTQTERDIQLLKNQMSQEHLAIKAQMTHDIQSVTATLARIEAGQGSTYVRWGRTSCDGNGTERVYSGYAGGSYYTNTGGASRYICLPENPSWANYKDGTQGTGGYVYGAEYEIRQFDPFTNPMGDEDVPCAVCHTPRQSSLMIPGSTTCVSGWTQEYTGYLMTGSISHTAPSDYACVDKDPEAVIHGEADHDGKLFYFTEAQCGSLPCQVYPTGRELACVLCSK